MKRAALLVALVACKEPSRAAPRPDAAPANHFDAVILGKPTKLVSAKAIEGASNVSAPGGLTIRTFDHDATCASVIDRSARAILEIDVPPGPADSYFVGRTAPARVWTERSVQGLPDVHPWDVKLALDPFDPKVGTHITGTLDIDASKPAEMRVHGRLDVEICEEPTPIGLPATVSDAPLTGHWEGRQRNGDVTAGTALAFVEHLDVDVIDAIDLFADPGVTCEAAAARDEDGAYVLLASSGFTFSQIRVGAPVRGEIVPARFRVPSADTESFEAHAWVRVDAGSEDEMTFAVAAKGAAPAFSVDAGGTITVRLCR